MYTKKLSRCEGQKRSFSNQAKSFFGENLDKPNFIDE